MAAVSIRELRNNPRMAGQQAPGTIYTHTHPSHSRLYLEAELGVQVHLLQNIPLWQETGISEGAEPWAPALSAQVLGRPVSPPLTRELWHWGGLHRGRASPASGRGRPPASVGSGVSGP